MNNGRHIYHYAMVTIVVLFSCHNEEPYADVSRLMELVSSNESKIEFRNQLTPSDELNILDYLYYYNGGGVAVGDINNDGLPDIYFSGNQVKNKLYLNKGDFLFEDITERAGVAGQADWNTGVTMADVNGDGLIDIYVCAVVGTNGLRGQNELFINTGKLTFKEQAKEYGLAFQNFSTQAAFFDYDNDNDLDMYLLNQAVHTEHSYGPSLIRNKRVAEVGDKLLRNDHGRFIDVSEGAGIYGGLIGYGLGVCTADFNNDGYTDLYVSNDFHENDYFYLNQKDGTFAESIQTYFGHTSRFSMGSDAADINNDGYYDLMTLDMMPEQEAVLKASVGEDMVDVHQLKTHKLGYHNQYARNMLQVNLQANFFAETAFFSGVSATDWSWSALFADFDLDGNQDLFVSNGIPKRPNDLDYINYISNQEIKSQLNSSKAFDHRVTERMPSGASQNYMYQGTSGLKFKNKTKSWLPENISCSNGSAYADFDNDGDLDLISNNLNAEPLLYKNVQVSNNHYLKLNLEYKLGNPFGIGTKVVVFERERQQTKQLYTSKGFQSSSEPLLHFGFSEGTEIDSIVVLWPDNTAQTIMNVMLDTSLVVRKGKAFSRSNQNLATKPSTRMFSKVESLGGIKHEHEENNFIDFKKEALLPYQLSDRSRAMAVGDLNNDDLDDLFIGGSKNKEAVIYFQDKTGFTKYKGEALSEDAMSEDIAVLIDNFDGSAGNDLLVVSGGGEFSKKSKPLRDRYYCNKGQGAFIKDTSFPSYYENGSVIKTADIDKDGDLDIFVGGRAVVNYFGSSPNSYLLENTKDGYRLVENTKLNHVGMVTDALFTDYDQDGDDDLIVIGEWMSPVFFQNNEGDFSKIEIFQSPLNGLWQTIAPFDIDNDGDVDYILGNWGLNSKYQASESQPLVMYCGDVDDNGQAESLVAISKNGQYYSVNSLDELAKQLPTLKKKFTSYKSFSGKTINQIFGAKVLGKLNVLEVHELASGYLRNDKGVFSFHAFEEELQMAPMTSLLVHDFTDNGKDDLLVAGNYFGVTPYHGRFDGLGAAMFFNDGTIKSGIELGINLANKSVRKMAVITFNNKQYLVLMINNGPVEFYEISDKHKN